MQLKDGLYLLTCFAKYTLISFSSYDDVFTKWKANFLIAFVIKQSPFYFLRSSYEIEARHAPINICRDFAPTPLAWNGNSFSTGQKGESLETTSKREKMP
jgi:hypothetical protein